MINNIGASTLSPRHSTEIEASSSSDIESGHPQMPGRGSMSLEGISDSSSPLVDVIGRRTAVVPDRAHRSIDFNATGRLRSLLSPVSRSLGLGEASATAGASAILAGLRSSTPSIGDTHDMESGMPHHNFPSRVMAFLNDLSVVQEMNQLDDAEFVERLRKEWVSEATSQEPETLLAALDERVEDLRSQLNPETATPEEREFLAEAKRYLEPLMDDLKKDISALRHDSGAAKRVFQGSLTLLLYPLPLATLFTQKTGTYAAFNIASYSYTAIQLVSLMRRPTTDAKLFKKHAINRHSLVFFISLAYAVPTFYKKAQHLQHNAAFVAGAAVAQGAVMLGLRLGQNMMESYGLRFNKALNSRRDLSSGFREAIDGILKDLRADLAKVDGFLGDFQQDRRITAHMDRQITFFKQDMAKVITGLERLLATGRGEEPSAASENSHRLLEPIHRAFADSFRNNPALKGKLALAVVGFTVLGSNIALMRKDGLALPDFIADAVVSSTFLLYEALSPHVSLTGMNDSVSDTVGGMTIGLPFSAAALMNGYMDDPKTNPSGFAIGTACYTAAYMLFGRVAGNILAKGLMATGGALGWGQRQAIQLGRSAMALGFKMIADQAPQTAGRGQAVGETGTTATLEILDPPLGFSVQQLESAERNLVSTLKQIDDGWHDARNTWGDSIEETDDGRDHWFDAEKDLPGVVSR